MKDDWLTIPDAPNYEINSQLICRNKTTGYILKPTFRKKGSKTYYLCASTKPIKLIERLGKTLRCQAIAACQVDTFEPIPSLDGKYEVNVKGTIRNANTKRVLKTFRKQISPSLKGRKFSKAVDSYLWEVHGIIKTRKKLKNRTIPVSCENEHGKHFFKNMKACARFLAPKLHYCVGCIARHLSRREENIFGWKITYLDADPFYNDYALANVTTPKEV